MRHAFTFLSNIFPIFAKKQNLFYGITAFCTKNMKRLYLIIYIGILTTCAAAQKQLHFLTFNCENAFDTIHDEGKNDYEYNAEGMRNWNFGRLYRKLDGIAKVIAACDTVCPVGLVGLCEVENDSVLEYLTRKTPLKALGYKYIVTQSEDQRGVDVALLYSKFVFNPVCVEFVRPHHVGTATRDILHVAGIVASGDTLDVYVVHLPSKLGGRTGIAKSMQVTEGLKANVDSVLAVREKGNVVIMGDFNADFVSSQFKKVLKAEKYWGANSHEQFCLYDVIVGKVPKGLGTYKYKGVWSVIDHVLVSGNVSVADAGVLDSPFLLEKDERYGGVKPKRTYVGYKYNGGISDHLPVWMRINL